MCHQPSWNFHYSRKNSLLLHFMWSIVIWTLVTGCCVKLMLMLNSDDFAWFHCFLWLCCRDCLLHRSSLVAWEAPFMSQWCFTVTSFLCSSLSFRYVILLPEIWFHLIVLLMRILRQTEMVLFPWHASLDSVFYFTNITRKKKEKEGGQR